MPGGEATARALFDGFRQIGRNNGEPERDILAHRSTEREHPRRASGRRRREDQDDASALGARGREISTSNPLPGALDALTIPP